MNYYVYILRIENNKLYIGHTNSPARRLEDHSNSLGAKYVRDQGENFDLVYSERFPNRAEAMKREKQLKKWTRAKKDALIAGDIALLKIL